MRNVCLVALALMLPASVFAQSAPAASSSTPRGFAAIHFGGQAGSSSLTDTFTFVQYDEIATVSNNEDYGGGFLFNIEGGYRFNRNLAFGVAVSRVSSDIDARVTASIPHPLVFDAPRTATLDVPDASHSETAVHFFVAYFIPVNEAFDVRVFAGPSVISARHDLVSAVNFTDAAPFTSVTLTGATIDERSETVGAFHIGAGGTYKLTDRFGVDGFFRFARRTKDIDGVSGGTTELKIGGAQFGIGVSVGF